MRVRSFVPTIGLFALVALVAIGCSSTDSGTAPIVG